MERYDWKHVVLAVLLFGGAGICEIGGGWLVWKWKKEGWPWYCMVLGSMALVLYGIIPTFQNQPFGRTYAAYGGFFIGLSLLWGFVFDKQRPDRWDVIGSLIAVLGAAVVMFGPRNNINQLIAWAKRNAIAMVLITFLPLQFRYQQKVTDLNSICLHGLSSTVYLKRNS